MHSEKKTIRNEAVSYKPFAWALWANTQHHVGLSYRGVHYWLEKLGASLKVPRKSHAKKDEGQSIRFKEELAGHLAELGLEAQKPFRLWVVDEHR